MAKAATRIETELVAKDKFSQAFKGVADKAKSLQKEVSGRMSGSGIAKGVAAGQAMFAMLSGVASRAAAAAAELGTISDRAQQMQVSAEYLQQLNGALGEVGVKNVSIDALTDAFDRMQKATGKVGAAGFDSVMQSLAGMSNEQERVNELGRIFGKTMGPSLAPLLRQGPAAFSEGLKAVMAGMPAVTSSAVNTGDAIADAMGWASASIKVGFQQTLGDVANYIQSSFGMSVADGLRIVVTWFKWGVGVGWAHFKAFGENLGMIAEFFVSDWRGALEWVANGIMAFAKASLSPFIWIFDTVKAFAIEFGKAFVKWITGDEADWSGALDKAMSKMGDASAKFRAAWADLRPTAPIGREWATVNMDALAAQRDNALEVVRKSIEAQTMLASSGDAASLEVQEAASTAKKTIDDAMKDAKFVAAGSYDALKLSLESRRASGSSSAVQRAISGSASADNSGSLLAELKKLLTIQEKGWRVIEKLGVA